MHSLPSSLLGVLVHDALGNRLLEIPEPRLLLLANVGRHFTLFRPVLKAQLFHELELLVQLRVLLVLTKSKERKRLEGVRIKR